MVSGCRKVSSLLSLRSKELQFQVRYDMMELGMSHLPCQEPSEGSKARVLSAVRVQILALLDLQRFWSCLHQRGLEVLKLRIKAWHVGEGELRSLILADTIF